jgi:hypothetical protein
LLSISLKTYEMALGVTPLYLKLLVLPLIVKVFPAPVCP